MAALYESKFKPDGAYTGNKNKGNIGVLVAAPQDPKTDDPVIDDLNSQSEEEQMW